MRDPFSLILLVSAVAVQAAPPGIPAAKKTPDDYLRAAERLADTLATVTDEKSAADAKPKIDDLFAEGRDARGQVFAALATADAPDEKVAAALGKLTERATAAADRIGREFDRIAADHKAAFKVLSETKLFTELAAAREAKAAEQARELVGSVRVYSQMNNGKRVANLSDIAPTPEAAKKYLLDPWGFPFQYKADEKRIYVWTVSPYSGKTLGSPPPDWS